MIAYGDSAFPTTLHRETEAIRRRLRSEPPDPGSLLIHAGQLEQGLADACTAEALPDAERLTDELAAAFLDSGPSPSTGSMPTPGVRSTMRLAGAGTQPRFLEAEAALRRLAQAPDLPLRPTVPEGPAFYALYPEQYREAARLWSAAHRPIGGRVLVVGIRSIGTSLSAVVRATLQAEGWSAHRMTVRPTGHPFERQLELDREALPPADWALVVDEGPGLSGSSMAAVGAALVEAGVSRERIAFLPGHGGEPAAAAFLDWEGLIREWWATTPRYWVPREALRWNGLGLQETLSARTGEWCGGEVEAVEDWGGGLWRRYVPLPGEWPAALVPFETPKVRVRLRDGRAVMWRFAGLHADGSGASAAESALARLRQLGVEGWTAPPLGTSLGWVAQPWIEGERPTGADPATAEWIGRYLAAAAGEPLDPESQAEALARLAHLLYWNTWEALGPELAEDAAAWSEQISASHPPGLPRYGDGRMAPHEWIRTPDGRLLKTDCAGHDRDHTAAGPQALLWDVAGALVEWDLSPDTAESLLLGAGISDGERRLLPYYRAAYAAFRLGLCAVSAASADAEEAKRLRQAQERYRGVLQEALLARAG